MELELSWNIDTHLGYVWAYAPNYKWSDAAGKVYQHRYVMQEALGRKLEPYEVVHHKDGNRTNNHLENLEVLDASSHAALHHRERIEAGMAVPHVAVGCSVCGVIVMVSERESKRRQFCSHTCSHQGRQKFDPSFEELQRLVWEMPSTEVATLYGVTDTAIWRRCKKMGIEKPPVGYWQRLRS
jgi:hypothetical protein